MVNGSYMFGSPEVGEMVCGPSPGMANLMTSTVGALLLALVSCMASLSVQVLRVPSGVASPVSAVELTVKVVAYAGLATFDRAAVMTASKRLARLPISHLSQYGHSNSHLTSCNRDSLALGPVPAYPLNGRLLLLLADAFLLPTT